MSLPNYLSKIKSSGVYRFTWDKSVVPPQQAETLRLVVGYSEKGPFNTPVYIETVSDFISIYGNISKRLERRGVYFHRLALQALQAGPILALNLKPFDEETVGYVNFNASDVINFQDPEGDTPGISQTIKVKEVFNTNRFWTLDADQMVKNINGLQNYMTIAATDINDNACTIFMRKTTPDSYNVTFRSWYASQGIEIPEYMVPILDEKVSNYFAEIYVFRGQFTPALIQHEVKDGSGNVTQQAGILSRYFTKEGAIDPNYKNAFKQDADALETMAIDSNSNFVGSYAGITLPYFKDANGNYISLDLKFNADNNKHKMLMKMDETVLDAAENVDGLNECLVVKTDSAIYPLYIKGYDYKKIGKADSGVAIWDACKGVLVEKGIQEALTNNVDVEYHYIVDTFDPGIDSKLELFAIAKAKDNAFAIVNFPKMTSFTDAEDVKSKFGLIMPSEVEGASWGAYYTQLTFSDGTVKSVVPSTALVSNLFMEKWTARQPYYIVAGPNYGRLSYSGLVGPDYNFGRSDLDILEPLGVNAIVYVPRLGTYINSNQTAKQVPVSGLSKVHIRELVIYLQNEVQHLLQSYQWEHNTQTLRDTIKAKADTICENIMLNGGLYAYKNVCDATNNTAEVIDNEMIILDTEIEPARGAGKMVHQLTIHKTGGLTSSVK